MSEHALGGKGGRNALTRALRAAFLAPRDDPHRDPLRAALLTDEKLTKAGATSRPPSAGGETPALAAAAPGITSPPRRARSSGRVREPPALADRGRQIYAGTEGHRGTRNAGEERDAPGIHSGFSFITTMFTCQIPHASCTLSSLDGVIGLLILAGRSTRRSTRETLPGHASLHFFTPWQGDSMFSCRTMKRETCLSAFTDVR